MSTRSPKFATGYLTAALCILSLVFANASLAKTRTDCDREYQPTFGQPGKDVPWEPTLEPIVDAMLKMAGTTPQDLVIDLGAGDGAIVIGAAKRFGAKAIGVEYNPDLVKLAQCYIGAEDIGEKAQILRGDIFKYDFSKATVLTLYLYPELNERLRPTILKMLPGTRVVSHSHLMGDWEPDQRIDYQSDRAFLWIVPAQVQGAWSFQESNGEESFRISFEQKYQNVSGKVKLADKTNSLQGSLRGTQISLSFKDGGSTRHLSGKLENGRVVLSEGNREFVGTRT